MARKRGIPLIRKNLTFPADFEFRFERMRLHLGATSDAEVLRTAFVDLERKFGFPPVLAIVDQKKKSDKK